MHIDRRGFIAGLGGVTVVAGMTDEAKADALERHLMAQTEPAAPVVGGASAKASAGGAGAGAATKFPTVADLQAEIETRPTRKGVGILFANANGNVKRLPPMPEKPTLADYFRLRFTATANHCLQSANRAIQNGMPEEVILACLLHDTVQELIKVDHGWWSAQMYEPYVSEKVAFAIRYHQALRFYEDKAHGYEYPDLYRRMFGVDYKPEPYIERTYQMVRNHKWYLEPRLVTVNDLYSFEPGVHPQYEQFTDIVGRHFKQPQEGLGFDNSASAHMWRSISMPDHPL